MMISKDKFKLVLDLTPLISIDFIVKDKNDKILLGKRVNSPAKGFFFTQGGRIFKNETIADAVKRLSLKELNYEVKKSELVLKGVFEHFYSDSIYEDISTHYVNIAYELQLDKLDHLPLIEHSEYRYFTLDELMNSESVHENVKDYFKKEEND